MPAKMWSRKSIRTQILELHHAGVALNSRAIRKTHGSLYGAANYHCGSWKQAIEMVGIKYVSILKKRASPMVWTKGKVIEAILDRNLSGKPLNYHALTKEGKTTVALLMVARNRFGSWRKAIHAAGLDYSRIQKKHHIRWSKSKIADEIKKRYVKGLSIKGGDVRGTALYAAARRHFGKNGWAEARILAGFSSVDARPWQKWKKENVVSEILALYKAGVSLNTAHIAQYSELERLRTAGRKVFGSWAQAVRSAGLDYSKIRMMRRKGWWSPRRVLSTIQKLEGKGIRLNSRRMHRLEPSLVAAGIKHFGSWSEAVESAGISYRSHCRIWSTKAWLRRMKEDEYTATLERAKTHARKRRRSK